jgi:hypothetical protein
LGNDFRKLGEVWRMAQKVQMTTTAGSIAVVRGTERRVRNTQGE